MFKKFPFVKQEDSKDCGPVCLQMIIKYYNGYVNLEEIRNLSKTNRSGTNAYNLIECAKEIGFEAYGIKGELNEIEEDIILPCIAHVIIDKKMSHFVVVTNIDYKRQKIVIADPNMGIKKINFKDFNDISSKTFIIMYPIKKIPLIKEKSLLTFSLSIIKNFKKDMFIISLLSILLIIFSITSSFYYKFIIDNMNSKSQVITIGILFSLIFLIKNITIFFRNKILVLLNQKIDLEITSNSFKQILSLPYSYFKDHTTGDVISRMNDLSNIKEVISKVSLSIFMDLPLSVFSFVVLYSISSELFSIVFIIVILYFIIIFLFKKIFIYYIDVTQKDRAAVTSYIVENIKGFETVKGLNIESKVNKVFKDKYIKLLTNSFKLENHYITQMFLKDLINDIGVLFIISIGSILVLKNTISLGTLLTFNTIMFYFLDPIKNIIDLDSTIKEANNSLKRILYILKDNIENGIIDKKLDGFIQFKNLTFNYDNKNIIKNVNFKIKKGSKVMIVGPSGCGKSSILKILLKYYPIERGQAYIDDVDINDYKSICLKKNIAYISQNENLYTDTLYNNLNISSNNKDKILNISKLCYVDEIIKGALGYNTLIEEDGFNISGGQKQRIILARTLLRNFQILFIDEGLNEIDCNLERKILKNIFKLFNNKTIIIISHRLENMDLYDQVINLKNNQVIMRNSN